MRVQLHRFRWYGLFFWVMLATALMLGFWWAWRGEGWLMAAASVQVGLWLWLATRAHVRVGDYDLAIRAGFSALDVPLHRIDADSLQLIEDDLRFQQQLEARPALHFGDRRYGWFSPPNKPYMRVFLASNGKNVLAFSYQQGQTQVRVSVEDQSARAELLAVLQRRVGGSGS